MKINFKTAKILKQKDFTVNCDRCYNNKEKLLSTYDLNNVG